MILSLHLIKFPDVIYILSRYCPSIIGELQLLTSINKSISGNWGDHYHLWELAQVLNLIWGLYRHLTRFTVVPLALSSQRHRFLAVKALVVILFLCNSWLLLFRVRAIALQFLPRFTPLSAQSYGRRLSLHSYFISGFRVHDTRNQNEECFTMTHYDTKMMAMPFVSLVVFNTAAIIAISVALITYVPPRTSWCKVTKSMVYIEHMSQLSRSSFDLARSTICTTSQYPSQPVSHMTFYRLVIGLPLGSI